MNYVVCIVPVAPMRLTDSHRSEMISQLLFGEFAQVKEVGKDFTLVVSLFDAYEGWIQNNQLAEVDESILRNQPKGYSFHVGDTVKMNETIVHLPFGCPVYSGNISFGKYEVDYAATSAIQYELDKETIVAITAKYLNTAYLWGGRTNYGIDCSGFAQQVFKLMGIALKRDAKDQALQGNNVDFLMEVQCGDLAFFDNDEGRITHVGIMLNAGEIIHASGRVRIDVMDAQGIINRDTGLRTHKLRIIKRMQ